MHLPLFAVLAVAASVLAQQPATRVLEGRVLDLRGEGVPVAEVSVFTGDDARTLLAKAVADGEGFFRIGKLPTNARTQIEVRAKGKSVSRIGVGSTSDPIDVFLHDAATVHGVVRDTMGQPVPGIDVRADPAASILNGSRSTGRTNEEGRFELEHTPLGPCTVSAWIDGDGIAAATIRVGGDREVVLAPTGEHKTDLSITIEGLPAGADPIDVHLIAYTDGDPGLLPPPLERPRTGVDGTWTGKGLPDRDYVVRPRSGRFSFTPASIDVKGGEGPHALRFVAIEPGITDVRCKATIRTTDGKPLNGVEITIQPVDAPKETSATSETDGSLQFASPTAPGGRIRLRSKDPRWVIAPDDPAEVTHLPMFLLASRITTVDPATTIELRAIAACTVHGRIRRADDRPAAFTLVQLQAKSPPNQWPEWVPIAWTKTGQDGSFRLEGLHHVPNAVRVSVASAAGSVTGEPMALEVPGTDRHLADLVLTEPSRIEGTVRDEDGRPLAGIRVWLRGFDLEKRAPRDSDYVETISDSAGRYRFLGAPSGGAYVELPPAVGLVPIGEMAPFEVEAGKTHTADLQAGMK